MRQSNWPVTCTCRESEGNVLKLLIQPRDGLAPLLTAIRRARRSIDILIFRMDWKELENALKQASDRGLVVRALIANTNRNGEPKLRSLETRFLEAGIVVGRTASDLIRYHGKMMIVDAKTLYLLSFNFVHIDIEHSRGFGIVTSAGKVVREAAKLFEADLNRQKYVPGADTLVVSPENARKQLLSFIRQAQKQLYIYDPKIGDKQIIHQLEERAKAGVEIKIIGSIASRNTKLPVTQLTSMRLHTRTMIRDGLHAFVGSQSLREPELEQRREIGIIVRDPKVVNSLLATFREDWDAAGVEETEAEEKQAPPASTKEAAKAVRALQKAIPPLKTTLKNVIREAGVDLPPDELKSTVKDAVKAATREAVREIVEEKKAS